MIPNTTLNTVSKCSVSSTTGKRAEKVYDIHCRANVKLWEYSSSPWLFGEAANPAAADNPPLEFED